MTSLYGCQKDKLHVMRVYIIQIVMGYTKWLTVPSHIFAVRVWCHNQLLPSQLVLVSCDLNHDQNEHNTNLRFVQTMHEPVTVAESSITLWHHQNGVFCLFVCLFFVWCVLIQIVMGKTQWEYLEISKSISSDCQHSELKVEKCSDPVDRNEQSITGAWMEFLLWGDWLQSKDMLML